MQKQISQHSKETKNYLCKEVVLKTIFGNKTIAEVFQEYQKDLDKKSLHTIKSISTIYSSFKIKYGCEPSNFKKHVASQFMQHLIINNIQIQTDEKLCSIIAIFQERFDLPSGRLFCLFKKQYGFSPQEAKEKIVNFLEKQLEKGIDPKKIVESTKEYFLIKLESDGLCKYLNKWYNESTGESMEKDSIFLGANSYPEIDTMGGMHSLEILGLPI